MGNPKYRCMAGSRPAAIFNAEDLLGAELALFVEGELDVMTAWQELNDVLSVVTVGSSTNRLDLATWGAYLLPPTFILTTYDQDEAGKAGTDYFASLSDKVKAIPLPEGVKDINDFYMAGGDLWQWLKSGLDDAGILQALGIANLTR